MGDVSHKNETAPCGTAAPKAHSSFPGDDVARDRAKRKALPFAAVEPAP